MGAVTTRVDLHANLVGSALSSTHFTVRTSMPLLLGILATGYGFSEGRLGDLGSAYSAGATLIALTSVVWLRGQSLRRPASIFLLLGLGALGAVGVIRGYPAMVVAFLLAGIGFGGAYSLMIAFLSRTDDPNRSYGWQWALGSLPGVLVLYALAALAVPGSAVRSAFWLVAAANALVAIAAVGLPKNLPVQRTATGDVEQFRRERRGPLWIGLFGLFSVYLGITGPWAFLGRVATENGLSGQYSGNVLAIGAAVSSAVALAAGELGVRGGRRRAVGLAVVAMLLGLALIAYWPTRWGYAMGTLLFIGLSTYVLTFSIAGISTLGVAGTAAALPAAALGAGSIVGPTLAGHVYQSQGARTMLLACALSLVAGLISYTTVYSKRRR